MVEPESSTHFASMANADESSRNPFDDSSSVYYLHPLNNPGALLVSEILTGANYVAWSRSISIALTVKNKIAFIDGTLPQSNSGDSRIQIAWLRANNLVLSWLMNSIAKEICGSLLYFTVTCDVWEELKTSQLLLQSPLPSMSKVFSLLLQEESQRSLSNVVGFSMDSHAMIVAQTQK
ncbi:uncharacterized protein LOC131160943 [Malania oleifera]|uniref:uncharacterized protein LOC131160943 n=1 Tax=Malania oleifera TaxID=397392 RepID=UPI0025ADC59B|nr:uncharacterized protein LOC131160943 [Malania oleifera]